MKYFSFYSRGYVRQLRFPRQRWGRAWLLTCIIWLMAWSLSFAQGDGARPEITVNMPSQVENNGEPFDIQISVRNVGNEAAQYGSITLSFPEGHDVSIKDASVLTPQGSECLFEGSHARVLDPDSGCEALQHNTSCQGRVLIEQPIAELFHRGWGAGEQQSMTVRVFPKPDSSFVTVYVRAAFRSQKEDECELIIDPPDFAGDGVDQQGFPVYTPFIELIDPPTEVVPPTDVPPTDVPPTETAPPPTIEPTAPPPTEVPVQPTATDVPALPEPSPTVAGSIATETPIEPTAIPQPIDPPNQDIISLFLSGNASNFAYMMLCVIFMVLFLIVCLLIFIILRSRGSSNPPPSSQPVARQPQPSTPPYHATHVPPASSPASYAPPAGYVPPAAEGPTRKWNSSTPPYRPPSSPPARSSRPMGPTQPEIRPRSSPFSTNIMISTPPIEPSCLQCATNQRLEASFCSNCGFPRPVVGERYALLRHLGKGGMGAVYLAQDKRIVGKQWAVKEMLDQLSNSPETQQKIKEAFTQEAQLLATLKHPNLPRVIDFLNEEERYYLVMDFVEGETLQTLLDMQQAPFPEQEVLGWVSQLCDVLTYLHEQQPPIIFRDLKPSNIMLTPKGRIQLIDFGIARLFKPDHDQDTVFMGTPGYAAPEQFSGSAQTDTRTDIYALGVVLHHLLTKHPPETTMFTMPKVRQLNPAVSPRMEAVIEQALQHNPAQRFASMIALKTALGLN